jgi:BTB/POZ domain/NHL repeat
MDVLPFLVQLGESKDAIIKGMCEYIDHSASMLQITHNLVERRIQQIELKEQAWAKVQAHVQYHAALAKEKVKLDIRGLLFSTTRSLLLSFEFSFFNALLSSERWQPRSDGAYFVNRDPFYFETMLHFMRTGHLVDVVRWATADQCDLQAGFMEEFDFYQIKLPCPLIDQPWKGIFLRDVGGQGTLVHPGSVCLNTDAIVVADICNSQIKVFDLHTGHLMSSWGIRINQPPPDQPQGFFCTVGMDKVFVSDSRKHRIRVYSLTGQLLHQWASRGSQPGEVAFPQGIAVDTSNGDVYVADVGNYRIQRFNSTGEFIEMINLEGKYVFAIHLVVFKGIIVLLDASGSVFTITDMSTIKVWRAVSHCYGLCISKFGEVFVSERSTNKLYVCTLKGEILRDLPFELKSFKFCFLSVSPSGYLVGSDSTSHRIVVIR